MLAPWRSGALKCPACGSSKLIALFEMPDHEGKPRAISHCQRCHCLVNETDLRRSILEPEDTMRMQTAGSANYYASRTDDLKAEADGRRGMIEGLLAKTSPRERKRLLDFGSGTGITASAGAFYFDHVIALEPDNSMRAITTTLPGAERISVMGDLNEVIEPVDAIIAWHVLEHLPELRNVFGRLCSLLKKGGVFYFQVPMLEPKYLCASHLTFLTVPACKRLCYRHGLTVEILKTETSYNYLTCIARK